MVIVDKIDANISYIVIYLDGNENFGYNSYSSVYELYGHRILANSTQLLY